MLPLVPPMLATSGRPRSLDGWVVEPKLDGWRAQVAVDGDGLVVRARRGHDITHNVPALAPFGKLGVECVLDGELIAGSGRPGDFYGIAGLASARAPSQPLTFVAFDVIHLHGRSLIDYDQASRRDMLDCLVRVADGTLVAVNRFAGTDLDAVFDCCAELNLEGVVVKRQDATYRPGRRVPV